CSFDEVAHLLLHGELPTRPQLDAFRGRLAAAQSLPTLVSDVLKKVPAEAVPMDVLRTAVSMLAHFDPDSEDESHDANLRKSERRVAQTPVAMGGMPGAGKGLPPVAPRPELGFAANLLYMLSGEPAAAFAARAFDVSLILYAEHEFNASTFTARVVTSTASDL